MLIESVEFLRELARTAGTDSPYSAQACGWAANEIERLRSELADRDKFVANDVRYCESRARRAAGVASNDTRSFGQLMDVVDEKIREKLFDLQRTIEESYLQLAATKPDVET